MGPIQQCDTPICVAWQASRVSPLGPASQPASQPAARHGRATVLKFQPHFQRCFGLRASAAAAATQTQHSKSSRRRSILPPHHIHVPTFTTSRFGFPTWSPSKHAATHSSAPSWPRPCTTTTPRPATAPARVRPALTLDSSAPKAHSEHSQTGQRATSIPKCRPLPSPSTSNDAAILPLASPTWRSTSSSPTMSIRRKPTRRARLPLKPFARSTLAIRT